MKRHILLAGLFSTLALSAADAAPYVGANIEVSSVDLNDSASALYPQSVNGFDIHVGDHFGNFAVEIGYEAIGNKLTEINNDLHIDKLTADGISYIPVLGILNILLTGGISETNYGDSTYNFTQVSTTDLKSHRIATTNFNGDEFDWRAGAGFSFLFSNDYDLHIIARYEPISMGDRADYALSIYSGVNIYF
jgi:hypothetical protein